MVNGTKSKLRFLLPLALGFLALGFLTGCGGKPPEVKVVIAKPPVPSEAPPVEMAPVEEPESEFVEEPVAPSPAPSVQMPEELTPEVKKKNDLAWMRGHPEAWPKEVVLLSDMEFNVMMEGEVKGSLKVPSGMSVKLVKMDENGLDVVFQIGSARVAIDSTDFIQRVQPKMQQGDPSELPPVARQLQGNIRPGNPAGEGASALGSKEFVHPGLLHTEADFDRMRAKVKAGESPWIEGWELLTSSRHAQLNWGPRPVGTIIRGAVPGQNFALIFNDIHASYQLALRWKISGDKAYADKAIEILNAWSSTLKSVSGNSDRFLAVGIYGYQFANAAEIMRTYPGWKKSDFERFQGMMVKIFYPMNQHFLLKHNDSAITNYWANWDLANIAAMQAIGVLCDRKDIYDEAMTYLKTGAGNGAFDKVVYYVHDGNLGQWQESGRDQGHSTLGIALMGPILETAWNQGEDLYGRDNNRFLAGAEYIAKFNLENEVPYQLYAHGTGQKGALEVQPEISKKGWPSWRAGYELVINHYVNRKGIAAPYSEQYAARTRPEGGGGGHAATFDQLGFGTLTATRDPEIPNPVPSGLSIQKHGGKAVLSWWGARGSESYAVKRGAAPGGPYTVVAASIKDVLTFTDENPAAGTSYYVVTGKRTDTETAPSNEVAFSSKPVLFTQLKFDESSGTVAADSVGRNPGTLQNATWTAGQLGNAVSLGGKKGYVSLPKGAVKELSDFTIATWVYLDASQPWARVFDFGDAVGEWMFLTPNRGNGMPRFEVTTVYGYNAQRIDGTAEFPVKRWVHVAVTLSGQEGRIYVDGVEVGRASGLDFPPFRLGETARNWIGRSQFETDPYLRGKVDDFRVYDGALTPGEILALARQEGQN